MSNNEIVCRLCGKNALEIGGFLTRMNGKGVPGVWECRPSCTAYLPDDVRVLAALESPEDSNVND